MQFFALNSPAQYGAVYKSENGEYRLWLRNAGMTGYICTVQDAKGNELAAFHGEGGLHDAMEWCRGREAANG